MDNSTYAKGLEGVVAAESNICQIDGEKGRLYYMGYSVNDLAEHCSFEEVTYLLLYGELPSSEKFDDFTKKMRSGRTLVQPIRDMIKSFPQKSHPMELMQSVIAYLSGHVEHRIHHSATCNCRTTLHQVSQLPSVIAAYWRFKEGKDYVAPREDLSHGANFLYMLNGVEPDPVEGDIMDKCFILPAEHGFNASTFASRVVASTMSTCYCSIASAIGALYGTLHGGANEKVIAMLDEIGDREKVRAWVKNALQRKQKIMGMGHRVYKAKDPRAIIMTEFAEKLSEKHGDSRYLEMLNEIELVFREKMEQKGKPIYPNVDFLSGAVYRLLNIQPILFTPLFAAA